jgi:pyruvate kinase
MLAMALEQALELGLVQRGDRVLVTAGVPFDVPGTTNFMKVETV